MAATAGLSFNIGTPMGKNVFKNASSLKTTWTIENQNCPGMIIGRSLYKFFCFFMPIGKSKMAATAGHRLTLDPMGKIFKCLLLRKLQI